MNSRIRNCHSVRVTFVSRTFQEWLHSIHQVWWEVKGLPPLSKYHPHREIIYVPYYPPQHLLMAAFALMLQGNFYDPITQGYTLSDRDLRLYNKIPRRFCVIYVTEILTVLLVYCIFWSEEDQLLVVVDVLFFCFFYLSNIQCASRWSIFFISLMFFLSDWDRQLKETCLHMQHELLLTVVSRK